MTNWSTWKLKKYNHLNKIFSGFFDFLIVVNNETRKEKYSYYLPNMKVVSIQKLNEHLLKIKTGAYAPASYSGR